MRLVDEAWQRVDSFLRVAESSFPAIDRFLGLLLWGTLVAGFLSGTLRLDRRLWLATALAIALLFVMPPNLFGVGYLDDRMPLLLVSLLAAGTSLAPDTRDRSASRAITLRAALPVFMATLVAVHLGLVTVGWARDGQIYRHFLNTTNEIQPGGLATSVYFGDAVNRDIGRPCKPLLFLLLLQNGTAVPTFANPTQQPLGLTGPLKAALESAGSIGRLPAEADRSKVLEDLATAGFETVVICDMTPLAVQENTMLLVGQGQGWALFQRSADRATPLAD